MSTWTSRIAAAGLLAAALSGCDAATGLPFAADLGALSEAPERLIHEAVQRIEALPFVREQLSRIRVEHFA